MDSEPAVSFLIEPLRDSGPFSIQQVDVYAGDGFGNRTQRLAPSPSSASIVNGFIVGISDGRRRRSTRIFPTRNTHPMRRKKVVNGRDVSYHHEIDNRRLVDVEHRPGIAEASEACR